jgi:Ca2+-binding EF-hand superfamily protein
MRMKFMGDRVMTRDEVVQHVREIFARFDTNKDGYVTREEMQAFHDKFANMGADMHRHQGDRGVMMGDRGAMFDRLDTNHDGVISRQEFMTSQANVRREQRVIIMRDGAAEGGADMKGMHMRGMGMHGMGMGAHLFEMADANHDGRVSLQEAQNAALAHFDRADLNHDGKLTPDERRQAHKLMRSERRPS